MRCPWHVSSRLLASQKISAKQSLVVLTVTSRCLGMVTRLRYATRPQHSVSPTTHRSVVKPSPAPVGLAFHHRHDPAHGRYPTTPFLDPKGIVYTLRTRMLVGSIPPHPIVEYNLPKVLPSNTLPTISRCRRRCCCRLRCRCCRRSLTISQCHRITRSCLWFIQIVRTTP